MKRIFIIAVMFGALSLILIGLVVFPFLQNIKKGAQELIAAKKTIISLQAEIENLERFEEIYQSLTPDLKKMEDLFVDPKVPLNFIKFLEQMAEESQVSLEILPGALKETKTDPWPSITFQVSPGGPLPNCLRFLEKIETAPYLIKIQNFSAKRLTADDLKAPKYKGLSQGDALSILNFKVFSY